MTTTILAIPVQKSPFKRRCVYLIVGIITSASTVFAQQSKPVKISDTTLIPNARITKVENKLTYKIISTLNGTYGYDVFVDERLFIHQTSIPALAGNEGFKTKQDASKVALLVIHKMKKGEAPPTVSFTDLKKLNMVE